MDTGGFNEGWDDLLGVPECDDKVASECLHVFFEVDEGLVKEAGAVGSEAGPIHSPSENLWGGLEFLGVEDVDAEAFAPELARFRECGVIVDTEVGLEPNE
jgi:hypothetical protein